MKLTLVKVAVIAGATGLVVAALMAQRSKPADFAPVPVKKTTNNAHLQNGRDGLDKGRLSL